MLSYFTTTIEALFRMNDSVIVLHDVYLEKDIHIDEYSLTLLNVSDRDRNVLLTRLREVRLEKLLNNNDLPIQSIVSHHDRVGNIIRREEYRVCLDSNLTFSIKERKRI
jgi:hypothetical protein